MFTNEQETPLLCRPIAEDISDPSGKKKGAALSLRDKKSAHWKGWEDEQLRMQSTVALAHKQTGNSTKVLIVKGISTHSSHWKYVWALQSGKKASKISSDKI